ncbi:hypothetical protein pdam_00013965 [Pocillopora damicornis]|uniref:Uncharacterized protein n=1 Tax=Pocillopora damicornis TaxID=46731 RepID=A0A3M6TBQ0_POCDA|nr:hypothetical protein pdam_00013965 [Pocillopora damicornis]
MVGPEDSPCCVAPGPPGKPPGPPGIPPPGIPPGSITLIQPVNDFFAFIGDNRFVIFTDLVFNFVIFNCTLHVVSITLQRVLGLNFVALLVIIVFKLLSLFHHALYVFFGQSTFVICDDNLVFFSSAFVHRRNIHNSIGINIKCDLNLRNTTRSRRNASELKLSEWMIVFGHTTFTFIHLDQNSRLVVCICCEDLTFLCWDCCVALDECCHNTSSSLNTQRQGSHIQKQQV